MNDAPQQIEAQIAASRAEMGAILDRIERKLVPTPRQLLHRGVDMLKDRRSASIGVESEGLRDYTVPLTLAGFGLGMLLLMRGTEGQPRPAAESGSARAQPDPAPEPGETPASQPGSSRLGAAMAEHPLALGAFAFLAGAVISFLLPRASVDRIQHLAMRGTDAVLAAVKEAVGAGREG